ncbi:uncharacterized protein isoform X1 [Musca autumnalis]|uniref:uncharacterized protein isoform X1 n=1 Tax=Musca autumnalis TaxID=221902 RepID=UPI003CED15FF
MKYENCLCFLLSLVVFLNINCNGLCNDDKARSIHLVLTVDLNTDNNNQTTIPIQPNTNNQTHVIPTRNETTTGNTTNTATTCPPPVTCTETTFAPPPESCFTRTCAPQWEPCYTSTWAPPPCFTSTCAPPPVTCSTTTCDPVPENMNNSHPIPENLNKPAKTLLTLNDCSSLPDNTYLVDSVHCRRFYICQKGRARRQRCSLTQWFDRQALQCRDRKSVTNCPANKP